MVQYCLLDFTGTAPLVPCDLQISHQKIHQRDIARSPEVDQARQELQLLSVDLMSGQIYMKPVG